MTSKDALADWMRRHVPDDLIRREGYRLVAAFVADAVRQERHRQHQQERQRRGDPLAELAEIWKRIEK